MSVSEREETKFTQSIAIWAVKSSKRSARSDNSRDRASPLGAASQP